MKHPVKPAIWLSVVAIHLLTLLAACETTGDPRQGGLIGWSEQKAVERQRTFEAERVAAQNKLLQETQRGSELATRQSQLSSEVQSLQASLAGAIAENNVLEAHLIQLVGQRKLGNAELGRLQQTLDSSRRTRAAALLAAADPATPPSADELVRHSKAVNQHNQQLHGAVMLLMGR
jgi:uncharacterized protein YPO0396